MEVMTIGMLYLTLQMIYRLILTVKIILTAAVILLAIVIGLILYDEIHKKGGKK
ncbi:MAG: hypothetical protein IJ439_03700 [Tyzzerella sp.]|nr:hypothetical protein [Tyzzerella sp.]